MPVPETTAKDLVPCHGVEDELRIVRKPDSLPVDAVRAGLVPSLVLPFALPTVDVAGNDGGAGFADRGDHGLVRARQDEIVAVDECEVLPACGSDAGVACGAEPGVALVDHPDSLVLAGELVAHLRPRCRWIRRRRV